MSAPCRASTAEISSAGSSTSTRLPRDRVFVPHAMALYRLAGPTTDAVEQAVALGKQTTAPKAALDGLEKRKRLDCHWVAANRLENDGDMKRIDIIKRKD